MPELVRTPTGLLLPAVPAVIHRTTADRSHEPVRWRARLRVEKREGDWTAEQIAAGLAPDPYEVVEADNNLLTTAGANALLTALVTPGGLATPLSTTNLQLGVGTGTTAPTVADTTLGAAPGGTLNTGDISGATNASPIVLTVPGWTAQPNVGDVVVVAGVNGTTNANGTFEVQAVTSTTLTLLGSSGNGAFATSASSTIKQANKYRQQVTSVTVTANQIQVAATFAARNANFAWMEWSLSTGAALTNKQASPPPLLFNHAVPAGGFGTKASSASWSPVLTAALA